MLPRFEQSAVYIAANFSPTYVHKENVTIAGVSISAPICPSDADASSPVPLPTPAGGIPFAPYKDTDPTTQSWMQSFTTYGANAGIWCLTNYFG